MTTQSRMYTAPLPEVLERRLAAVSRPGLHTWAVISAWHINDPEDGVICLDHENLVTLSSIGCLKCGIPYFPGMQQVPCAGDTEILR